MSIILKSGAEISRSPLNNSKAHQMYSFPKAERFPKIKSSDHTDAIYNLPDVRSKRTTSLGFGNKSDFKQKEILIKKINKGYFILLVNLEINIIKFMLKDIKILIYKFLVLENIFYLNLLVGMLLNLL